VSARPTPCAGLNALAIQLEEPALHATQAALPETSSTALATAWLSTTVMTALKVSSRWVLLAVRITGGRHVARKVSLSKESSMKRHGY
jgi:hypothetical protein